MRLIKQLAHSPAISQSKRLECLDDQGISPEDSAPADSSRPRRNRRAAFASGVATIARALQVGSSLTTVPLTVKHVTTSGLDSG